MRTKGHSHARGTLHSKAETGCEADERIAAGLNAQDQAALRELISRHGGSVYGMTKQVCRDPRLAEDAAQETFLALWRRPQIYDPTRGSLKSLVLSIARNKAIDLVRREEGARRNFEPLAASLAIVEPNCPSDDVDRRDQVERALAKLTDSQRDAIRLAYFGGRTYREVAGELGIPEGTAKTRLRDGLSRLRQILAEPHAA